MERTDRFPLSITPKLVKTFELRLYPHPGKYEGGRVIDEFVDNADWFDEATGSVDENGTHYGILVKGFAPAELDKVQDRFQFTPEEREYLCAIQGAIVSSDSQGFVTVEYFDHLGNLIKRWKQIEAEVNAYYASEDMGFEDDEDEIVEPHSIGNPACPALYGGICPQGHPSADDEDEE